MQFDEVDAGDFRIYAGAIEKADCYGYVAAVVVVKKPVHTGERGQETFRDVNLGGGFTWSTPGDALRFAINAGRDAVMCRAGSLA
ncbi:MAG: hypothetical protein JO006_08655 [Paucibacter sp.]|nr:hypothetical protein [Roseateles sp.]